MDIIDNLKSFKSLKGVNKDAVTGFFGYSTPIFNKQEKIYDYSSKMQDIFNRFDNENNIKVGIILPNRKVNVKTRIMESVPCFLFIKTKITCDSTINGLEKIFLEKQGDKGIFQESDPDVIFSAFMLVLTEALNVWQPKKYSMMHYYLQFQK